MFVITNEKVAENAFDVDAFAPGPITRRDATVHIDSLGQTHLHDRSNAHHTKAPNQCLVVSLQFVGTGILVTLCGKLDEVTAPVLSEILSWPEGTRAPRIYLDLEHVWSVDTAGLQMIEQLGTDDAHVVRDSEACTCLKRLVS